MCGRKGQVCHLSARNYGNGNTAVGLMVTRSSPWRTTDFQDSCQKHPVLPIHTKPGQFTTKNVNVNESQDVRHFVLCMAYNAVVIVVWVTGAVSG